MDKIDAWITREPDDEETPVEKPKDFPIFTRNGGWKLGTFPFDWADPTDDEYALEVHQWLTEEHYNGCYELKATGGTVTVYCNWNPGVHPVVALLEPNELVAVIRLADDCFLVGIEDQTALFSFIRYMREVLGGV